MLKMRLFEMGHSMAEIEALSFDDYGLIVGYFSGKRLGEDAEADTLKHLEGG